MISKHLGDYDLPKIKNDIIIIFSSPEVIIISGSNSQPASHQIYETGQDKPKGVPNICFRANNTRQHTVMNPIDPRS